MQKITAQNEMNFCEDDNDDDDDDDDASKQVGPAMI